jgi:hypothetical protein
MVIINMKGWDEMSEIKCKSYGIENDSCKIKQNRKCGQSSSLCCIGCDMYISCDSNMTVVCNKVCFKLED